MSTETAIITQALTDYQSGYPLNDLQARVIASVWHTGQTSRIYAFASTGNTADRDGLDNAELLMEIDSDLEPLVDEPDAEELHALRAYIERAGVRGPQDGWSDLSW